MAKLKLKQIKELFNPEGPIGNIISPSITYKERQGWHTTSTPHVQRAALEDRRIVDAVLATAPTRFVSMGEIEVPRSRERQISAFVVERYAPVYEKTDSTDLFEILRAGQNQIGWNVSQHSIKETKRLTKEDFEQICQTVQIQATEEFYCQFMETIPGNDPVIIDGEILRTSDGKPLTGGTLVKGRQHYNQLTKNMVHWDKGVAEKRIQAQAEMDSRPVRNVRRAMEAVAGEKMPMWKPTGINFRRDRRSAV